MPVLSGSGSNGKTQFSSALRIFSQIVKSAHKSTIMQRHDGSRSANPELHMLKTCRIALVSETKDNEQIDEDTFKRITGGGDELVSRNLFQQPTAWLPRFVPFMPTNNVPKCSCDPATLGRIMIVEFLAKFVDEPKFPNERKKDINIKLRWEDKDVKEAVLSWIVEGAVDYYHRGLHPPEEIQESTASYREDMNSFESFLKEEVDPDSQPSDRTSFSDLFSRFNAFIRKRELVFLSSTAFGKKMAEKYKREPDNTRRFYSGIKLVDPSSQMHLDSLLTIL